ncbi:MAG: DUF3857 domain-containing protein [Cyclobacteriaceae bacterium]
MRRIFISVLFLICIINVHGKDAPRYPVSAIPEELKKGAHAVVREDLMFFTIHSKSTASLHVHMVVTIFNGNGKHFAKEAIWYDKLRKITSIKAQVLDAEGMVIKKLKNNEITDHSAFEGMFSDNRVKVADLTQGQYPYTVEFEYDVEYKFLYDIDGSAINPYEDVSVQYASYKLNFPENLKPRYKTYNTGQEPEYETNNGIVSLTWSFENIKARKFEAYSDLRKAITRIDAAPTVFEFEGYAGTMESWNEYGKWIATLNKGRNVLPEETRNKIKQITEKLQSREEKVKALYEFMQNKTRYVSIQLGIGGYQPFEASLVDKTGYGDCKALSNYMLSMLETIGIKGHYALILAGENKTELETDFPSSQFNHAIVAVPNGADTLWLECTSQTNPFGYQGTFTGDRKALLITDKGAAIVNTTRYPAEVNTQATSAEVKVELSGDATARVKRTFSGLQYENGNLNFIITGHYDDQKKWLQNHISIPSFDIRAFSMKNVKERIPTAVISADLTMNRFATVSGKRIFLTPNLMNRNSFVPEKMEDRKAEILRRMAYIDVDTVRFQLPEDIYPEFLPEDVRIKSRFGEYEATFKVDQGNLVYFRKVKMNKGEFPASSYQELVDFYRGISKADNIKMVFMSKT